ncbi:MAG: hypothetical protein ACP5M4_09955 [Acidobacteriaceae bacterium]
MIPAGAAMRLRGDDKPTGGWFMLRKNSTKMLLRGWIGEEIA